MTWKDQFPIKKRYFETDNGILYIGDTKEIVKDFDKEIFDLILTDPPYCISKEHNFSYGFRDRYRMRTGLYFGDWDQDFDISIWEDLTKLVSKDGSIVTFLSFEQYEMVKKIMEDNKFKINNILIWRKTNSFPKNRDRKYISNIELIIWSVREKGKWTFNRIHKFEESVLTYPSESGFMAKRYHTTQKPLKLIKYLLQVHSNKNNLILDPFIGSGTTAVACELLNRRWIGIEISKEYCEIVKQRIQEIQKNLTLPLWK